MNYSDQSFDEIQDSGLSGIAGFLLTLVIAALAFIPFIANFKDNDNHLNWLNHDYGKNLMASTEMNSLLMTEGGDNQVFSTLYFTYAEKVRPDLTPYDQKGNIFKRIYWDMRYVTPQILSKRQQLVDSHLFSGEEPFYPDRSGAEGLKGQEFYKFFWQQPYFIPYWMGKRPVYLTWKRPKPWTLGDYYYKRYGIMYKVQDIAYSLVDHLELMKRLSVADAQKYYSGMLHRQVPMNYTLQKIKQMQKEGWLKIRGNNVDFVKMYPSPHPDNYLKHFLLRWHDIPNAKYWDYLTREIMINYDYQLGNVYLNKVRELRELKKSETRPAIIREINNRIKQNWQQAKERYDDAVKFGGDSISALHNIAVVYLNNGVEDLDSKARPLLEKAMRLYPNSFGTFQVYFLYLIKDIFKHPAHESKNLTDMNHYMQILKVQLTHYKGSEFDYRKNPNWKNFGGIENYSKVFKGYPTSRLMHDLDSVKKNFRANKALAIANALYRRGTPLRYKPYIENADQLITKILEKAQNNVQLLLQVFQISLGNNQIRNAYLAGRRLTMLHAFPKNQPVYSYYMGKIALILKKNKEAKPYFTDFIKQTQGNPQMALQLQRQIKEVNQILTRL